MSKGHSQNKFALAEEQYEIALNRYRSKEYGLAKIHIDSSISYSATAKSYYLSGILFEQSEKYLRALSDYEATIRINAGFHEAYFKKGLINLRFYNSQQAFKDFDYLLNNINNETRSIFYEVDNRGGQQNTIMTLHNIEARLHSYRGQASQDIGNLDAAMNDFEKSIALNQHPDYYLNRALLLVKLDKKFEAEEDLRKAIEIQPDHQLAWYNLLLISPRTVIPDELKQNGLSEATLVLFASRAFDSGDYEGSLALYNKVLSNSENVLALINRGRVLSKLKRFSEARRDFERARYNEPDRIEVFYLIGNTFFFEKVFENAVAYYNQYLITDPAYAMVWHNLGMAHFELDNQIEACHALNRAQELGMVGIKKILIRQCQ